MYIVTKYIYLYKLIQNKCCRIRLHAFPTHRTVPCDFNECAETPNIIEIISRIYQCRPFWRHYRYFLLATLVPTSVLPVIIVLTSKFKYLLKFNEQLNYNQHPLLTEAIECCLLWTMLYSKFGCFKLYHTWKKTFKQSLTVSEISDHFLTRTFSIPSAASSIRWRKNYLSTTLRGTTNISINHRVSGNQTLIPFYK